MIRLTAYKEGRAYDLDVSAEIKIPIRIAFANPGELTSRTAPYSGSFALPFSNANKTFFGQFDLPLADVTTTFNPYQAYDCVLSDDGTIIVEGKLQLRGADTVKQSYSVSIVGNTGDLIADMGNTPLKKVFEATASDYNYQQSNLNVFTSADGNNDITIGNVGAGVIRIPLADYGLSEAGYLYGNGPGNGIFQENFLDASQLFPALSVAHTFQKIVDYFGYNVDSDFFATDEWTELYFGLGANTERPVTKPFSAFREIITGLVYPNNNTEDLLPSSLIFGNNYFRASSSLPTGYDPDDLYNGAENLFIAPATMTATFRTRFCIDNSSAGADTGGLLYFAAWVDGVIAYGTQIPIPSNTDLILFGGNVVFQGELTINLTEGDAVEFGLYWNPDDATQTQPLLDDVPSTYANPYAHVTLYSYSAINGSTQDIGVVQTMDMLPDISCADFVRDMVQRFNLTIVQQSTPTDIKIEPMSEYLFTGEVRDWSDKIHRDGGIKVLPLSSIRNKRIEFNDGVDADYTHQEHQRLFGFPLGGYEFETDDEFAKGNATVSTVFSTFATDVLPQEDGSAGVVNILQVPIMYAVQDGEIKPVSTKPKLGYMHYVPYPAGLPAIFIGDQSDTQYGYWGPFASPSFTEDTQSIYYSHQLLNNSVTIQMKGLVESYYSSYLADIYSDQGKLIECELYLTAADLQLFQFSDEIVIDGGVYRCIEINYTAGAPTLAKAKFLKRTDIDAVVQINPGSDCQNTFVSLNGNGTTLWTDPDGNSISDPGLECCSARGYVYNNNLCWWNGLTPVVNQSISPSFASPYIPPVPANILQAGRLKSKQPILTGLFPDFGPAPVLTTEGNALGDYGASNRAVLRCTTYGTGAQEALPYGDSEWQAYIGSDYVLHLQVRAVGVIVTPGNYGTTGIFEESILLGGDNKTNRVVATQNRETSKDAAFTAPTISASFVGTAQRTEGNQAISLSLTGTANEITVWTIYIEGTYINLTGAKEAATALFYEDDVTMATEAGGFLLSE